MLHGVSEGSNHISGRPTFRAVAAHGRIVVFPPGNVPVHSLKPLYDNEMDMILTLLNWWQPLAVHGVRVVPLLMEGK